MFKLGSDSLKERNTVTKGKVNHLLNVTPGANITSKVCHCQKNSNASNSECSVEWQQHHREGRQQLELSGKFFFLCTRGYRSAGVGSMPNTAIILNYSKPKLHWLEL